MAKKIKDTDYLAVSAQIRAMENHLLNGQRLEQVLTARSMEDALKIVQEFGYPDLTAPVPEAIDSAILAAREKMEREIALPDVGWVDVFKYKHDYHNLKTLLKARLTGVDASHILVHLGRFYTQTLRQAGGEDIWDPLPDRFAENAREAKRIIDTTRDGQLMDIFLDRVCYQEMLDAAQESPFLTGFIRRQIDSVNLRALVRTLRMKKTAEFLRQVLIPGGTVAEEEILAVSAGGGSGLEELYASTVFVSAVETEPLSSGALTEFERLCDDAVTEYLDRAGFVPFGEEAVIAYFAARETEFTNLRIVLLGRSMDLPADVIRARLRA